MKRIVILLVIEMLVLFVFMCIFLGGWSLWLNLDVEVIEYIENNLFIVEELKFNFNCM